MHRVGATHCLHGLWHVGVAEWDGPQPLESSREDSILLGQRGQVSAHSDGRGIALGEISLFHKYCSSNMKTNGSWWHDSFLHTAYNVHILDILTVH